MQMIFERVAGDSDYLEFILTPRDLNSLATDGLTEDFPDGFWGHLPLNVFIRINKLQGDEDATSQRSKSKIKRGVLRECATRDTRRKASKTSSRHRV